MTTPERFLDEWKAKLKFTEIQAHLEGIPYMEADRAKILYSFIIENNISECLELGFAHGVGSCYIAAALDEVGSGHLTGVDLIPAKEWQQPSIEDLLAKTGLTRYVTVAREPTSYTWYLKKKIEENSKGGFCEPIYDFCFIDGPKNWTIDGCAFFLVDKLLKQNGWLLFDDFSWKYSDFGQDVMGSIVLRTMGEDELNTPQIELVFRLLVMQHPNFANFRIQDSLWAWAQKVISPTKQVIYESTSKVEEPGQSRTKRLIRKLLKR